MLQVRIRQAVPGSNRMDWVLVCVGTMLAVEVFLHTTFKRNIHALIDFTKRAGATVTSARISDHWKEKVLLHYAVKIFVNSIQLALCLLFTAAAIFIVHLLGKVIGLDLFSLLMTPVGLMVSIIFASLYALFRVKVFHVGL